MKRILFVDDDREILDVGKRFLEIHPDFEVDTIESVQGALSLLKQNPYDAIISDYFMPDMDGVMFLKSVRSYITYIPFIIFTGYEEEAIVIEALNNGADFYLKKSYDTRSQFFELAQIINLTIARVQSEEQLRKSEEKFRTIAEYSHEWMYWIDPEGNMIYVSPSCEQVTGYTREEFYLDPDLRNQVIFEEDRILWSAHQRECLSEKCSLSIDIRIVHKGGEVRWISHVCQSIIDANGIYAGRRVSNRDVTSRKNTESLLLRERDNFLKIFQAAPVGLLLMDKNTEITQANEVVSELILRDPADIIRKRGGGGLGCIHSLEDPRGCGFSTSCPDCPLRNGIEGVIRDKIRIHGAIIPLTLNGEGSPGKRWLNINAEPVEIEGAEYVIVAVDDITEQREMEGALRESEKRFRLLSDSTTAGILMYQGDYWIYANPAAEEISGYSQEELLSMQIWDIIHPDFRKNIISQAQGRGNDLLLRHNEIRIRRKTGEERWVDLVGRTISIDRKTAGLITAVDITARKKAEEKLRKSEEHYRSLFDNMLEGFAYCRMVYDEHNHPVDWIYLEVNDSFEHITGLSEIIGKSVTVAIPGIHEQTPELFEIYNRVVRSGIPETFEINFTPIGSWLKVSAYRPEKGHFVAVFENITKQKKSEATLQKIIRDHQTILENVQAMIWYKDIKNTFIKVNPAAAQIYGKQIQEIEGRSFSELFPGIPDLYYPDDLEVITQKKPKIGIVEELTTALGVHLWVQTDKVPLVDDHGEVIGVLVVSTDITEKKMARDAVSQVNRKLNLLSSITRHDVANQLQGLFFSIDMAQEETLIPEIKKYIEKADIFAHNIERQMAFTRDYQDIGVNSPVWQIVQAVVEHSVKSLDLGSIQIHIEIPGLQIYADPLLEKVFHNLIDNAIRYGETITWIRFSGVENSGGYVIICSDDGVGIPAEFKSKIFNREYFTHTGFGLNLSREILDITGITITETGEPGKGANFEIHIPAGKYRSSHSDLQ